MKIKPVWLLLALPCLAVAIALLGRARDTAAATSYPLQGTVVSVASDDRLLLIEHDDIPGFMPPMTMYFRVDAATHQAARAGDRIAATMIRQTESLVLQDVKLAPAAAAAPPQK
ncbi:MAG: copper-binding protein [Opitutaceae bacterium]|nr:copper-binding protein [Opitutaceae bacterium]